MLRVVALFALAVAAGCGNPPVTPPPMCTRLCTSPNPTHLDLIAGQPGGPGWVDGVGAAAHFADPWTFAGDGAGHLFLADASIIRRIDVGTAEVTTIAGAYGVASGTDGVGAAASFYGPSGLAAQGGTLFVTDTENHTIRKIDLATAKVTTFAGGYGSAGSLDANGTQARFREPEGIALDGAGNLFVADTDNNTIRQIVLATGDVTTIAGTAGVMGAMDGSGGAAQFAKPKALVADGLGHVFVLDSGNLAIRTLTIAGAAVSTLAVLPTLPTGLALDGTDLLASLADHRVVRIDGTSGALTTLAGVSNQHGYVDGAATDARFSGPAGLWNEGGNVYVADEMNQVIRKIVLATGQVSTLAGANPIGSTDGTGGAARFFVPQGLTVDSNGIAYAADTNNHTIRKIVLTTGEVTTLAGTPGQMGIVDDTGAAARFNTPGDVALDEAAGILYVADTGNRAIRKLDLATGAVTRQPIGPAPGSGFTLFDYPTGIVFDAGKLYLTDYTLHILVAVDLATSLVTIVAGKPRLPGPTDGVGADARFYSPSGVVSDGNGVLYVADVLNDAVRKVKIADGTVTTVAGTLGAQGSDDGPAGTARFSYPSHLAIDGVGDLYVADLLNNAIRHVDVASGAVTTLIGSANQPGVKLGPLPAQLTTPSAVALTPDARIVLFSESALLVAQ